MSIAPALRGDRQPQREFLYREFSGYGGQQAVWMGQWKGIRQRMLRNNPNPLKIELYNLRKDPSESKDVAEQYPEIVAQIRENMKSAHVPSERFPIGPLDKLAESER